MSLFLGIDTSNYTTSTALYDSKTGEMVQQKKLLPVKEGQLGLRQSDAVFHHTAQLHTLIEELLKDVDTSIRSFQTSYHSPRRCIYRQDRAESRPLSI